MQACRHHQNDRTMVLFCFSLFSSSIGFLLVDSFFLFVLFSLVCRFFSQYLFHALRLVLFIIFCCYILAKFVFYTLF